MKIPTAAILLCSFCMSVSAEVTPNGLFCDNMVLQRDMRVPVWGKADPGENITVTFAGQTETATADDQGKWRVMLAPMNANAQGQELVIKGNNIVNVRDVLIGEVWLCSGQSNMEGYLWGITGGEEENDTADFPRIRMFKVAKNPTRDPTDHVANWGGKPWNICKPKGQGLFSALGFLLAKDLHLTYDVPVGMIQSTQGGTRVRQWSHLETLRSDPDFDEHYRKDWEAQYPVFLNAEEHKQKCAELKAAGADKGEYPPSPSELPSSLYNGMIHPLMPFAIRGIFWYQGESDAYATKVIYRELFPAMIEAWRDRWGQGDIPLVFVQLPNYHFRQDVPGISNWAFLRESQFLSNQTIPNSAMVITIDSGPLMEKDGKLFTDIHPRNKQTVSDRVFLAVRNLAYGERDVVYSGPLYAGSQVTGDRVEINFSELGGGLVCNGDKLVGFAIAGSNRQFVRADAVIEGDEVVVSSKDVPEPKAVRYAWAENPDCNLFNKAGLPASPFRTDD